MKLNKTAVLTSVGAGLEYYDFVVYAFLAQYIGYLFFPAHDYYVSIIAAFGVFAVGYFVRPIGGVIFGVLGDKYGRKRIFLISILLMAFSTFLMGLMPSYESIGLTASILFMFLRVLQGISFGAELPGATTFITEHSSNERRGLNCALMVSFVTVGVLSGSFIVYLMTEIFSLQKMYQWGWRIPFLIGGLLAVIAYFIRTKTEESPYFKNRKNIVRNPFSELLKKYPLKLLIGCGFIIFPASMVMFVLAMPTFFVQVYKYSMQDIYLAISMGYVWSIITVLVLGFFSDYISRKKLYSVVLILFILLCFAVFHLLTVGKFCNLVLFMMIYQTFISAMTVCFYPMLSENFSTGVRYTGVAFCYNIVYAAASLIPLLVNYFYKIFNNVNIIIVFLVCIAIISLICSLFMNDYTGRKMEE